MVISRVGDIEVQGTEGAFVLTAVLAAVSMEKLGFLQGGVGVLLLLLSLLAHEAGHLVMAQALGVKVRAIGMCFRGAYLRRVQAPCPGRELLIALAGPFASFLLYLWLRDGIPLVRWVALLNLVLAISNLVPLRGTDGHRIVCSVRRLLLAPADLQR